MKPAWYFRIVGIAEDFDNLLHVEMYNAEYYAKNRCLQDRAVMDELSEALQTFMNDEVCESQFFFDGKEQQFRNLMAQHGIKELPE